MAIEVFFPPHSFVVKMAGKRKRKKGAEEPDSDGESSPEMEQTPKRGRGKRKADQTLEQSQSGASKSGSGKKRTKKRLRVVQPLPDEVNESYDGVSEEEAEGSENSHSGSSDDSDGDKDRTLAGLHSEDAEDSVLESDGDLDKKLPANPKRDAPDSVVEPDGDLDTKLPANPKRGLDRDARLSRSFTRNELVGDDSEPGEVEAFSPTEYEARKLDKYPDSKDAKSDLDYKDKEEPIVEKTRLQLLDTFKDLKLEFGEFCFIGFVRVHADLTNHYCRMLFAAAVKDTCVRSEWTENIQMKIKFINQSNSIEYKKVTFDERVTLALILPIRFANLKAQDCTSVSSVFVVFVRGNVY